MRRWGPGQSLNLPEAAKQDGANMGPGRLLKSCGLWPAPPDGLQEGSVPGPMMREHGALYPGLLSGFQPKEGWKF